MIALKTPEEILDHDYDYWENGMPQQFGELNIEEQIRLLYKCITNIVEYLREKEKI